MERCLITGATRGMGRAIALRLAGPDKELLLHGRNREALEQVRAEVENAGAKARVLLCDLSNPAEIETMIDAIGTEPLRAIINNAGIAIVKPLGELSLREWQDSFAVNVTAPFLLIQKLSALMEKGAGVVNILSVAARTGFPGWSSYCMSKFALEGFTRAVREELRPRGIRVINIYPSATNTDLWNEIEGDWPRDKMLSPDEVAEAVVYALTRPDSVLVEDISLGNLSGTL